MWNLCSKFGTWSLMDPSFLNGAMDVRTFYDIYVNPLIDYSQGDSDLSDREDDVQMSNKFSSKILSAPAEASLRNIIGGKRNTEETDKEEDDYSLEEDDEPASKKVRKSEVPKSIRTVKGQGKYGKSKERWRNGDFADEQVTNDSTDIEGIDVTSLVELFELFWDVDLYQYI
ncbi:hypothetical protein HHI36_011636 [Cryptolaemus montrouzieri]|uniref:Uncharacterized protein n=1 Tax=Cryptolaemus montrouzieri TaxID=559131 RepID=A0ABD2MM88_9CUCU